MMRTLFLCHLLLLTPPVLAEPELYSVWPLACQIGKEVDVQLIGKELGDTTALLFSNPSISATAIEGGKFRVRVDANAKSGECDIWCIGRGNLSNPRRFLLTQNASIVEQPGNDTQQSAQLIPLPGSVDGRLETAAKLDWYQFNGQRGNEVTLICRSRTLDGSVEPDITVIGPSGRELAHANGRRREPVLTLRLPADGAYRVRISDRAYRKNDQSFYRLELMTGIRVLGCFPNILQRGVSKEVSLFGFGLTESSTSQLVGSRAAVSHMPFRVQPEAAQSPLTWQPAVCQLSSVSLALPSETSGAAVINLLASAVTVEDETHTDSSKQCQSLERPVFLNGRFDRRGDIDWYSFSAKKGESIQFELYGDRLGRQMDLDATILDESGKTIITFPDLGTPKGILAVLTSESLDVSAVWKAPADGNFRLVVRDLFESLAGADRSYGLSLEQPSPKFRVYAIPVDEKTRTVSLPQAGYAPWRLFVTRQNGFAGSIRITLEESEMTSGIVLNECWIGPSESSAFAMLTTTTDAKSGPRFLKLKAEGQVGERTVHSTVSMMTPLTNHSSAGRLVARPAILVTDKAAFGFTLTNATPSIAAGQKLKLIVTRSHLAGSLEAPAKITFPLLPAGIKSSDINIAPQQEEKTIELVTPKKLPAGRYSFAATVSGTVVSKAEDKKPMKQTIQVWTNSVVFEVK